MTGLPRLPKVLWYFLGMSYTRYSSSAVDDRNTWYSTHRDVVRQIKRLLHDRTNSITQGSGRQVRLQIRNRGLQANMAQHGLGVPKSERLFPQVPDETIDHFVRGLYDSNVSVSGEKPSAQFYYPNVNFKKGLNEILCNYAGIKPGRKIGHRPFSVRGNDLARLHDFIYRDWEYIRIKKLYIKEKYLKF